MEATLPLKNILNSIINKAQNLDERSKKSLLDFNEKLNLDKPEKKINLTLVGNISVGKTTLINHIIRYLVTQRTGAIYNFHAVQKKSNPNPDSKTKINKDEDENEDESEDEEEEKYDGFIELSTKEIENTYFVCFVENSESKDYEIVLEVHGEEDRKELLKTKLFENKIFDNANQIILKFSNSEVQIKKMNKFLNDVDYECLNLIKRIRVKECNKDKKTQEEYAFSRMIIKVPDFPKEYRLIDSPGISIASFKRAFIKIINDLDYINYFLIVNDIFAKESYTFTEEIIKEVTNELGSPIIYSFFTKGNNFLDKYPKINKDYESYVRVNSLKIKDLENMKEKINFRKIIPINDKNYNEDVKKCLYLFFTDLDQITKENAVANYEASVMFRLRGIIYKINDNISNNNLFTKEQIESKKLSARNAKEFYEREIKNYFEKFSDNFDKFKQEFADYLDDLNQVYDKHEYKNYHRMNRSNYINKHIELSFEDFKTIILKQPKNLLILAFDQISEKVDEEIHNNMINKFKAKGLLEKNSSSMKIGELLLSSALIAARIGLIVISLKAIGFFNKESLEFLPYKLMAEKAIFPVIGFLVGGIGVMSSSSAYIGLWVKENTREDITKALLKWLDNNKSEIIEDSIKSFNYKMDLTIKKFCDSKLLEKGAEDLFNECEKFKPRFNGFPDSKYQEELLTIIEKPRLKNFFKKVFEYKEPDEPLNE